MKNIFALALVAVIPCAFGACASSAGGSASVQSAADAYSQAVAVRDQIAQAKEEAEANKAGKDAAAPSTKEAIKQAFDEATSDVKAKTQAEIDAWKAVVK